MEKKPSRENRLKSEKSPYLIQHAENPVDWYPWGSEAMEKAAQDDKPILLSIGYSTCHWCHVMARESFEDQETARIMNDRFINIKVDREERPDIDRLYMKAVQAMTGHAGWPLTVFMAPDGRPFYGGSYYPPEDRFGMPSLKKVLLAVSEAYRKDKSRISAVTGEIESALADAGATGAPEPVELGAAVSDGALAAAKLFFDPLGGGFGVGAKFPHAMCLKFLLLYHRRTGSREAASMVERTLAAMAFGGVHDHLGGGFHRYSVDDMWEVPHFEKMLYDNAQLTELYAMFYDLTSVEFFKEVALDTIGFLMREMRSPEGGFYSAMDADSEGQEGGYYLWTPGEMKKALGRKDAERFMEFFSVTEEGNCDGKNTLRVNRSLRSYREPLESAMKTMREKLLAVRLRRVPPDRDRKIIAAWNGLAVRSLVVASRFFKDKDLLQAAAECMDFMLGSLRDNRGRLMRYYIDGSTGPRGNLEDYALTAVGLLSLFEATGDERWLAEARSLTDSMIGLFYDRTKKVFFDTGKDQESLFVRERDLRDTDIPSGNSAAADALQRLWCFTHDDTYRRLSIGIMESVPGIRDEPLSHGNLLCVLEGLLALKENWRGVEAAR